MNHSEYQQLLSLAHALTFISESELLWSLVQKDSDHDLPSPIFFKSLLNVVASAIYENLTE